MVRPLCPDCNHSHSVSDAPAGWANRPDGAATGRAAAVTGRCPKTGKQSHHTKAGATRHLHALKRIGGIRLHIYRCRHCKGWHVGHYCRGRR